jgi:hypothetical protein
MRTRTVWILVACIILIPLLLLAIGAEWLLGWSQLLYKPVRYRVATTVEVLDHGRTVRSVVNSDCWGFVSTRGIVQGVQKSRRGEDNHVVLGDGSILILSDLDPCRWVEVRPALGSSHAIVPAGSGGAALPPGAVELRPGQAWRFDNAAEPTSMTIYDLPALFTLGSDGVQITSATIAAVAPGPATEVTYTLENQFPWFRDAAQTGQAGRPFFEMHHLGNFIGFRAAVTQRHDAARCPAHDPAAEGPIVISTQEPCTCPRGDARTPCESAIGWLAPAANSDFSELAFASAEPSKAKVAVLYRELALMKGGAPGDRSRPSLLWRPRICLDGLCVEGAAASFGMPSSTKFYYPARNQVVTISPSTFYAPGSFRRSGAAH